MKGLLLRYVEWLARFSRLELTPISEDCCAEGQGMG
jgi:hypothetical protein